MQALLKILGFEEKVYSWGDLDSSIKQGFFKRLIGALFILAGSFFVLFQIHEIKGFIVLLLCSFAYAATAVYYLLIFMYKKFTLVVGECVNINLQRKKVLKQDRYGKAVMIIKSNNMLYEIPIDHSGKYKTGAEIAVYLSENNLIQTNNDYFQVLSPLAITIINQMGVYDNNSSETEKDSL